jgi:hypothetical protein
MNEENYKGLKKQLETHSLDIASQLTILELAYKNQQELQAYKDKEDRLREYIEELKKEKWQNDRTDYMLGMSYVGTKVLQILNDKVVE